MHIATLILSVSMIIEQAEAEIVYRPGEFKTNAL